MRKLVLATTVLAGTALGGAAFAAGDQAQAAGSGYEQAQQTQMQQGQSGMQQQQAQIQLQQEHVREIQQALQQEGQDLEVDGMWGPNTEQALREYQQEQGIESSGQLNFATLDALGVDVQQLAQIETEGPQAAEAPGSGVQQQPTDQQPPGEGALPGAPGAPGDGVQDQPGQDMPGGTTQQ